MKPLDSGTIRSFNRAFWWWHSYSSWLTSLSISYIQSSISGSSTA